MRRLGRISLVIVGSLFLGALVTQAQDEQPSLGDVARQSRLQKQQKDVQADQGVKNTAAAPSKNASSKDAASKDATAKDPADKGAQPPKASKQVITNDEIPEHIGPTRNPPNSYQPIPVTYPQPVSPDARAAEQVKTQILSMKNYIASMQSQLNILNQSIHYAGGNCVSGCVQWNERQKQKQEQAETMKEQLAQQQKRLEEMQETARRQGFGSSVYDP